MRYRVAFASIDGSAVDQHFGSARYWQIYDIDQTDTFVETRRTVPSCHGNCEGGFQRQLTVLADCDAIFVSKIGENAAAVLQTRGKRVFEAAGPLDLIIEQLIEQDLLNEEAGKIDGSFL